MALQYPQCSSRSLNEQTSNDSRKNKEKLNQKVSMVMTLDPGRHDKSPTKKFQMAGLASLLFFIYASCLVINSIIYSIFRIHGAIQRDTEMRTYYGIYLYGIASIFYIYIEIDQFLDKRRKNKEEKIKEKNKRKFVPSFNENGIIEEYQTKNCLENVDEPLEESNKQHSKSLQINEIVAKPQETETIKGILRINSRTTINKHQPNANEGALDLRNNEDVYLTDIPLVDEEEEVCEEIFLDLSRLGSIFSHHGSSFFLRIGSLLFGVGHIIYIFFELMSHESFGAGCTSSTNWWELLVRLVFVVLQMFVLFKNHQFTIKLKSATLHKFGYIHILATNLCMWINTLAAEIDLETHHIANHTVEDHAETNNPNNSMHTCVLMKSAAPYLFPFILEYCLLCFSIVAVLYLSLKEENKTKVERGISNLFKIDVFEKDQSSEEGSTCTIDEKNIFSKSHTGIFAGCLLLAAIIVLIVFFGLSVQNNQVQPELIYLGTLLGLNLILLAVCIIALHKLSVLAFIAKPYSIDDALMIVAMFGGIMYDTSIMYAAVYVLRFDQDVSNIIEILRTVSSIVSCIQQIFQVALVLNGLRRYPLKSSHLNEKPGRTCLTFLVVANITAWIFYSTVSKTHVLQSTPSKLFGEMSWIILSNISLPLLLFFYFHSAVCIADIWHIAYHAIHHDKDSHTDKLENIQNLDNNPLFSISDSNIRNNNSNGRQSQNVFPVNNLSNIVRSVSVSQLVSNLKPTSKNDSFSFDSLTNISPHRISTSPQPLDEIKEYDNGSFM